jgi:hypothetical protein
MREARTRTTVMVLLFLLVSFGAQGATPDLIKIKQSAQAKGFIFETSHEDMVAKARKEGKLPGHQLP